jgi:HD-GYP domain-containing protein (c-di-GMP phosphodiesterase class II)
MGESTDRSLEVLDFFMNEENTKMQKIAVKDFAKKIICDGHVYLSIGSRKFYIMKPGIFVDQAFLKKHAINSHVFDFESVISDEIKKNFKQLFKELKYLQFEKDLREKCFEIIQEFKRVFNSEEHFLTFALACYEEFCQLPLELQSKMHETDMHLYRKSLYAAAFSVIVAISNDFYHYPILKDFYHLTFLLDSGVCETDYSYFVAEACNHENKMPGSGKAYLENEKASELEKVVFLGHPEKSYKIMKSTKLLAYPEMAETLMYQHELSDGSGFPKGINKGQVSSWEAVVIFSDSLVEISAEYFFEKNVVDFILNFQNKKLNELPVQRVYKKVMSAISSSQKIKETGS